MFVRAAGFGRLKPAMQGEMRAVAGALRRAVVTTGGEAQSELRAQARSAGFKDGGRSIANAWRLNLYPAGGVASTTFKPVALVWSRMPTVVDAFVGGTALNVSFTFICPTTFEGAPGQLRWQDNGAVRLIQGNVNADTTADLTIFVKLRNQWMAIGSCRDAMREMSNYVRPDKALETVRSRPLSLRQFPQQTRSPSVRLAEKCAGFLRFSW